MTFAYQKCKNNREQLRAPHNGQTKQEIRIWEFIHSPQKQSKEEHSAKIRVSVCIWQPKNSFVQPFRKSCFIRLLSKVTPIQMPLWFNFANSCISPWTCLLQNMLIDVIEFDSMLGPLNDHSLWIQIHMHRFSFLCWCGDYHNYTLYINILNCTNTSKTI